jgi:oxalate decarboxylase
MPPPTDHGDIGPIWYSFDLARKRVEEGGWTHHLNIDEATIKKIPAENQAVIAG